jgi:hypothetical protein
MRGGSLLLLYLYVKKRFGVLWALWAVVVGINVTVGIGNVVFVHFCFLIKVEIKQLKIGQKLQMWNIS